MKTTYIFITLLILINVFDKRRNIFMNDEKWLSQQINEFVKIKNRYQIYSDVLQNVLEKAVQIYAPLSIVQTRPKSIASFGEKALRKKFKYDHPVKQITDLCGGRIITHTRSEINTLSEFIKNHFEIDWNNSLDVSQRLKPTEFGYRSIHYIIMFKPGVFPTINIPVKIPNEIIGLKAEVQLKTILEHAWANFSHDYTYKGAFKVPEKWERELAALAASLEVADNSFSFIQSAFKEYAVSYGSYLTEKERQNEIKNLETILRFDKDNVELANRIGKLAIISGDFKKAIDVLSKYINSGYPPILRDLGVALCKSNKKEKDNKEYRRGQKYLEEAITKSYSDTDAISSLAGTWKGIDDEKAQRLYRQAFKIDPSDPYPLGNYIEYKLNQIKDTSIIPLLNPVIKNAIKRCKDQADVGLNLPWAFYDIGKFNFLLGRLYESLEFYSKAIYNSTADFMIETTLNSHEKFKNLKYNLIGYDWIDKILLLGLYSKYPSNKLKNKIINMKTSNFNLIKSPVVIIAGVYDRESITQENKFKNLFFEAFKDFKGTIISGGTTTGLYELVGELGQKYDKSIRTIGYVPKKIPKNISIDKRYDEIRYTDAADFSPLEPLQYWVDIFASDISPSDVKILGINHGKISDLEYMIALAFGAQVAISDGYNSIVKENLKEYDLFKSKNFITIPTDKMTYRTYIEYKKNDDNKLEFKDILARQIHDNYREFKGKSLQSKDPSMVDWEKLPENLKESNRQQANNLINLLNKIGYDVKKVKGGPVSVIKFTKKEVETLAEMEHGRWNIERLLDGWTYSIKKDVIKKTSPYIVSWSDLPEDIKEFDRETIRKTPKILAVVGLEIIRVR
jgi:ppGpp synthetase/RelA/SpoT-type nucleotidyltranferase